MENIERELAAIEARRGGDKCAAHADCYTSDIAALLALVRERDATIREQQAKLERVEALHVLHEDSGKCAECTVSPYSMHSVKWPCPTIAAITATEAGK